MIEKLRKPRWRADYPAASRKEIIVIAKENKANPFQEIENYLDSEPKRSITEDLWEELKDRGIFISEGYVLF